MALFILPRVKEADYPALRRIMFPILPATYAGWLALLADLARPYREHDVHYVEFFPDRFEAWMKSLKREPTVDELVRYVNFNPWFNPK